MEAKAIAVDPYDVDVDRKGSYQTALVAIDGDIAATEESLNKLLEAQREILQQLRSPSPSVAPRVDPSHATLVQFGKERPVEVWRRLRA